MIMIKVLRVFCLVLILTSCTNSKVGKDESPTNFVILGGKTYILDQNGCKHLNPNPQPNETASWSGQCVDGYADGYGVFQYYRNGEVTGKYVGEVKNGVFHGKGTYTSFHACEDCWKQYSGEWQNDYKNGQGVAIDWNGDEYNGLWKNGAPLGDTKFQAAKKRQRAQLVANGGKEFKNTIHMSFVKILGGSFSIGEKLPTKVENFYMSKTEVTQAQWMAVMNDNPSEFTGMSNPVDRVSWRDVTEFIDKLNRREAKQYRLPTEAEWEYAARARTTTRYYWGDNRDKACFYENVFDQSAKRNLPMFFWDAYNCNDDSTIVSFVGVYKPNPYGLYDMLGNVSEWTCSEWDDIYVKGMTCATSQDGSRVVRGSSYLTGADHISTFARFENKTTFQGSVGFRLIWDGSTK